MPRKSSISARVCRQVLFALSSLRFCNPGSPFRRLRPGTHSAVKLAAPRPGSLLARQGVPFRALAPQMTRMDDGLFVVCAAERVSKAVFRLLFNLAKSLYCARMFGVRKTFNSQRFYQTLRCMAANVNNSFSFTILHRLRMNTGFLRQRSPGKPLS